MDVLRRAGGAGLTCLLCITALASPALAGGEQPGGRFEIGLFIPYSSFDTDAPIEDTRGLDDAIENAFGRGVNVAWNFNPHHAVELDNSWVTSDGEDMGNRNFFSVRTRYTTVVYRHTWRIGQSLAPFATVGPGTFYARALEVDHPNKGGNGVMAGAGLRYFIDRRASVRAYIQTMRIFLDPDDAINTIYILGLTVHLGSL